MLGLTKVSRLDENRSLGGTARWVVNHVTVVCKPCPVQDAPLDDLSKEIIVSNKGIPIEAGDQSCLC